MSQSRSKLGPRTERIFKDIAERIIPSGGPDYPGAGDTGLADNIIAQLGEVRFAMAGLTAVIWLWEVSPFFFSLKFKPFSRLSPEDQTRYMEKWEESRFIWRRLALIGLKSVFQMFFYNNPLVWEKIGYTEECLQNSGEDQGRGSEVGS